MTQLEWQVLGFASKALESSERDVVLGDLAESREGFGAALRNLFGLVMRRQASVWTDWHPWAALLGISLVAGVVLSRIAFRFNVDLGQQLMAYRKYGVHFETGLTVREDLTFLLCSASALSVWSWVCGFVLGSLSRKTVWLTWLLFYLVVLNPARVRFVIEGSIIPAHQSMLTMLVLAALPLKPAAVLFLFAAAFGTWTGVRRRNGSVRDAWRLFLFIAALTILMTWMSGWYETAHEVWSEGVWPAVPWTARLLPFLLAGWPAVYLLFGAYRQQTEEMNFNES